MQTSTPRRQKMDFFYVKFNAEFNEIRVRLIECNMRNIIPEKSCTKCGRETSLSKIEHISVSIV